MIQFPLCVAAIRIMAIYIGSLSAAQLPRKHNYALLSEDKTGQFNATVFYQTDSVYIITY